MNLLPKEREKKVFFVFASVVLVLLIAGVAIAFFALSNNKKQGSGDQSTAITVKITDEDIRAGKEMMTTNGAVTKISATEITIKNAAGVSETYKINQSTSFIKGLAQTQGSAQEVLVGSIVGVNYNKDNLTAFNVSY